MAWSCLTRNRDNNGDGVIDRNEVRWYLAACNQLAGMWIGNKSLSLNARLYRPAEGEWRAHVMSSSGKMVSWTEEGGGATPYSWDYTTAECWKIDGNPEASIIRASHGESVRCLRNIGTYNDDGLNREISEAPYQVLPEKYFTVTDNQDGSYTFHFDRINPKSLREFSAGELPYHDQQSESNSVYQKMTVQSPAEDVPEYKVKYQDLNNEVTTNGYNAYCPPGYRFPNQREMLLMTLYLPRGYFEIEPSTGLEYNAIQMPTRTYYDRGYFGSRKNDPASYPTEKDKVGWAYNKANHKSSCTKASVEINHSRCVRDDDMTGTIEGGILMKDEIYAGDAVPLSFSFYSSGASFISASLKLCFTDGSGIYHERDIPVQKTPSGLEFLTDQTVSMPTLGGLGLTQDDLDANDGALRKKMKFKFTLRNTFNSQTFEQPFYLGNPLSGSITADNGYVLPSESNSLTFHFSSKANDAENCAVTGSVFRVSYTDIDGNIQTITDSFSGIPALTGLAASVSSGVSFPAFLTEHPADTDRPVTLSLLLTDAAGNSRTITSSVPLHSHINQADLELVKGSTDVYPVRMQLAVADGYSISSASLLWTQDGTWHSQSITAAAGGQEVNTTDLPSLASFGTGSYVNYRLKAVCSDGTAAFSPVWSMKFLRYNYSPAGSTWYDSVDNLDLSRGDYLEAKMTMVDNSSKTKKAGLLSIGDDISQWANGYYLFHFFLGDKATPSQYLRSALSNGGLPSSSDTSHPNPDITIRLDGTGLFVDEKEGNAGEGGYCGWSKEDDTYKNLIARLGDPARTSTLQIGQNEGDNRSYSTYHYIRAVRKYEIEE